jgi:hypothetical protein
VLQLKQQLEKEKGEGESTKRSHAIDDALTRMVAQNEALKAQVMAISHGSDYSRT